MNEYYIYVGISICIYIIYMCILTLYISIPYLYIETVLMNINIYSTVMYMRDI